MKKIFIFLFALVLALSFSLVTAVPVAAAELHVGSGQTYATIQAAIAAASDGDTIIVHAGTYIEVGQIVISKNLTIIGADKATTIIKTDRDTAASGDAGGWFLVNPGITFNLSKVTLDGSGHKVRQGIRDKGKGTISDCSLTNIQYNASGPDYQGQSIVVFGTTGNDVNVTNCTFSQIGRVGVLFYGTGITASTFTGNTYVGKGTGNWLDYAVEVGAGAVVTITGNTITGNKGVPTDLSVSAGIIVMANSQATINDNSLSDNTWGVAVGGGTSDTGGVVTFSGNNIYSNDEGIHFHGGSVALVSGHCNSIHDNTTYGVNNHGGTIACDFECNWWGDASGPSGAGPGTGDAVSTFVDYSPWLGATCGTSPMTWYTNDSIQDAIDAASAGDTVNVVAGTYDEQVVINKSLTLQGAGDTTIVKPSSAAKLTQVFNGLFWYGGTKNIAGIIVANVAGGSVTIKNLKVDESLVTTKPSGADYLAGVFYRETGGTVDTVTVAGTGAWCSGDRAFGMYLSAGGNTVSVEVKGSTITNFDKEGINAEGNTLTVNIHHNTITGRGPTLVGDEVQNGVDIGRDAVATVNYNTISNLEYGPQTWWAAGILVYSYVSPSGKSATAIGNTITNCQIGIMFKNVNATAQGNTVSGGTVGLCGIGAEPNASGATTASFVNNTVSGISGTGHYAIGANTYKSVSLGATLTATINNNQLTGGGSTNADGIIIGDSAAPELVATVAATITNNNISGWQTGIHLIAVSANATGSSAHFNNIVGNTLYGASNAGTGTLDATYNWWGSSSGPYHATLNPGGTGDAVSDYVDFEPWLLEVPTVTTQAATEVSLIHATLNMNYTVGGYSPVQVCFAYKKSANTEWSYTGWVSKTADGTHAEGFVGLPFGTQYDFKAQLKYDDIVYGETVLEGATLHFTTAAITPSACFIATAAYGTPTAEQIDVLREFRDVVLLKSTVGSQFVALYYQLSPPIADFIAGNELLRTLVREFLVDPIVWVVEVTGEIWRN